MTQTWPVRFATLTAALLGPLMLLMGGGHLYGIISVALGNDAELDYRLVSLITTGLLMALPGLVSLTCLRWLWQGRIWAYATCILSASTLMAYLTLLLSIKVRDSSKVGSELNMAAMAVAVYLAVMISVWCYLVLRQRHALATPADR
ncbi:hypothetical protein R0135_06335 [Congregibacter variabilis]|uniref:Uncharacterized protein n=1 Tax=Congregibacter variabilis TaxID=3081200 RepID=A0ABZ0I6A8_9GAMM|nr:hypothetical protein R0135_06335 [Congregibacter sp. IMCC43200]